jgi:acetyl-CoA acetyltransferase
MGHCDGAVIVSSAQTPYSRKSDQSSKWYLVHAIAAALAEAGIDRSEVDGLAVTSFLLPPDNVTTVAQDMGFETRWGFQGAYGGAAGVISVLEAVRAVSAGCASVVVCAAADSFTVARHDEMVGAFTESIRDYIAPLGFGGANGLFALVQQRHMHEFGTRREQLGKLAVTQRGHACLNPNAVFQEPLTFEQYMEARVIADPIHLFDCVLPCAGGDAVVVTTPERARECPGPTVRVLSGGQAHNWGHNDVVPVTQGWVTFADRMFDEAGVTRTDVDFVQLYDDYPIMEVIQLEDLGFCQKGDGGAFITETDVSLTGDLPVNTGGGQLSAGQAGAAGGMIGVTEAVTQLKGLANGRQVRDAALGLVSGFGMVGFGRGLSCSAMLLANEASG